MSYTDPATGHAEVTAETATFECRSLYIGTGGQLDLTMGGVTVSYVNVPDGFLLPVMGKVTVEDTSTAADIVALY